MRKIAVLALLGLASLGMAQVQFDDITKRMASPAWGTAVVGSYGTFREPCNLVINNYNDWCKVWPYVAGPYYQHGMQVPPMINWGTEQLVVISLGNLGARRATEAQDQGAGGHDLDQADSGHGRRFPAG